MNIQQKKELTLAPRKLTFEGVPCKVAGWANDNATITAEFPGFWFTSWETVERVLGGEGNLTLNDIQLISMRWRGTIALPEKVRHHFNTIIA
jgi:hypothetical protein